ncbi:major facilitator superfamily member protein [Babesia ovata]|uniref:Major facilitator superfamily member protein n=1 Tax=Babesia ovata TaxID=189622 RepID=A0A2H6K9L0_9APIC|nr:major facilitator superfamily member protein [Babesia ovata]GBE59673.1 major facilitator superfamily member protein [Babesia ovata]
MAEWWMWTRKAWRGNQERRNNLWQSLIAPYNSLLVMGMASIVLSSASQYRSILFLRFLHGFGFACVYPVQQKIVADSTSSKETKKVEGTPNQGKKAEGAQNQGKKTEGAQNQGKKAEGNQNQGKEEEESKAASRYVWILFGIGIIFGMESKPSNGGDSTDGNSGGGHSSGSKKGFKELIEGAFTGPFKRSTTWLLILTLFIAEAPMSAFNYMTIYLQYLGVSDTMAGVAIAVTLIGGAAGSGAGGVVIKEIAKQYEDFGELSSGMVVMAIRLVVCLLFFLGKPPCGKLLWYHYVELATLGATLVTVGGVDRALLKSAIEKNFQATTSAMIRTISGIASSVILFQVSAYLTEKVFGYVPSRESFETMDAAVKEKNAEALRKSMMNHLMCCFWGIRNLGTLSLLNAFKDKSIESTFDVIIFWYRDMSNGVHRDVEAKFPLAPVNFLELII